MMRNAPASGDGIRTLITLSIAGVVAALQPTLVVPQLPHVPDLFVVSTDDSSWIVTVTVLSGTVSTPILTRLADMFGKKLMLIVILSTMTLGSTIALLPLGFAGLLAARALQGVASALMPIAIALLRDVLEPRRLSTGIALVSSTMGIGTAAALPLSGLLYESLGWESLFWGTGLLGLLAGAMVFLVVPSGAGSALRRFDWLGALVLSGGLTLLLFGITKSAAWGYSSPVTALTFASATVVLAAWIALQLRTKHPLVDIRLALRPVILLTNAAAMSATFAMFLNTLSATQEVQVPSRIGGIGLDSLAAGLTMLPAGLMTVAMFPVAGRMIAVWGGKWTLAVGAGVMAGSYTYRMFGGNGLVEVIVASTLIAVGGAMTFAAMPALIMGAVSVTSTAAANGVNSVMRHVGSALASASLGTVLAMFSSGVGRGSVVTLAAFEIVFVLGAVAAVLALGTALFIPRSAR